jgi:hypothetical protein
MSAARKGRKYVLCRQITMSAVNYITARMITSDKCWFVMVPRVSKYGNQQPDVAQRSCSEIPDDIAGRSGNKQQLWYKIESHRSYGSMRRLLTSFAKLPSRGSYSSYWCRSCLRLRSVHVSQERPCKTLQHF